MTYNDGKEPIQNYTNLVYSADKKIFLNTFDI